MKIIKKNGRKYRVFEKPDKSEKIIKKKEDVKKDKGNKNPLSV